MAGGAILIGENIDLFGGAGVTRVEVMSQDEGGVILKCHLAKIDLDKISTAAMPNSAGEEFALLSIPGGAYTGETGKPRLPMLSVVLDAPWGAAINVHVMDAVYRQATLADWGITRRLMPAQFPVPKTDGPHPSTRTHIPPTRSIPPTAPRFPTARPRAVRPGATAWCRSGSIPSNTTRPPELCAIAPT